MRLFRRKKAVVVLQEIPVQPRELTGIEKTFIEEEQIARAKADQAWQERKAAILIQISELERQIAPQKEEIEKLRMVIEPYRQYANLANLSSLMGQQQYQAYGAFNSLLGSIGIIGGRPA